MIHPEELNILSVFENNGYIIPIYQRSYAWEKEEIEQLITDIADSDGRYYLGSLIVDQIDGRLFSVIDGQQRLTTIFLLLSHIQPNLVKSTSLKFEARAKSNRTLTDLPACYLAQNEDIYSEEILSGYDVIVKFFKSKDTLYLKNFIKKLSNIIIIKTQVPKKIDLNHYFEIMNTRGEQLEIHEIAKGRLLSVIDNETERDLASIIWDACSQMDSYIQMNFEISYRNIIFGEQWDSFSSTDFITLYQRLNLNKKAESRHYTLNEILGLPTQQDDTSKKMEEENERFESIIRFPNFLLIVNEALKYSEDEFDSNLDDKKILENLHYHWNNNKSATDFIYSLLKCRFLFDKYIIKREYAKEYKQTGKWSLQKLSAYTDSNKKPSYNATFDENSNNLNQRIRSLQSALRITYTSPKMMHWISLTLSWLYNNQDIEIINLLEKYCCNKLINSNFKTTKGFGIERIVFTYLDYILDRDLKVNITNFQFQFRTSIEHFHPQNPIDSSRWKDNDLHSFGNLALITVKANSKFSNLNPQSKIDTYPDTINQSPKLKLMAEIISNNAKWNESAAQTHENEMFSILDAEIKRFGLN